MKIIKYVISDEKLSNKNKLNGKSKKRKHKRNISGDYKSLIFKNKKLNQSSNPKINANSNKKKIKLNSKLDFN